MMLAGAVSNDLPTPLRMTRMPPRTERFGLALSRPEREGLRTLAAMEGLAEADVIRRLLRPASNDLPPEYKQAINWPTGPDQFRNDGQVSAQ